MESNELRTRLVWLITARLVVSTVLLGWAVLLQVSVPQAETHWFYLLIALTYALSLASGLTARFVSHHLWLIDVQLACDAAIISLFIAFTGGIASYFPSLYFLPIIAAGSLQSRRAALTVALLSGVLYAGISVMQYQGVQFARVWGGDLPELRVAIYTLALNVFAFIAVAYLAGSLAEGMRSAGARLEEASTAIASLQALNEYVVNSLMSGLVTSDYAGNVLTFNRAAEAITGRVAETAIGRNTEQVLQLPSGFLASLEDDLGRNLRRRIDFTYTTGERKTIEIGLSATHLVTPDGKAGFVFNFQDITDAKKRDRDARIQQRLAAVGQMAAGIAHEIRNPLASISGSIQVLRQELELNEEQGQLMDIVLRESERLNGTIRSFLAYARPQKFAISRLQVAGVVRDVATLLKNSGDVHENHAIEVEAPDGDIWYEADESQFRQIVWNLATNALRAMPDGGKLRLLVSAEHQCVVLAVQDNGVGIAPENLDGIFQPFQGTFVKGSGLGLAIVHRIVSDYGGEIQVTSKQGEGTTVRVRLPHQAAGVSA